MQTSRVFTLTQPAAAVAKDIYLHCGWRPAMVISFSGHGILVQADGSSSVNTLALPFVGASADGSSSLEANAIEITDDGFKLGSNASFVRVNIAEFYIIAVPPGTVGPFTATLDDEKIGTYREPYGSGTQFDATPQDSPDYDWISKEA